MRLALDILAEATERPFDYHLDDGDRTKPFISAWVPQDGDKAHIYDFWVPTLLRGQGAGRAIYQHWEANLPANIELVDLNAVDEGHGHAGPFWSAMGFEPAYEEGGRLSDEARELMWKGVNGHPTPPQMAAEEDEEFADGEPGNSSVNG